MIRLSYKTYKICKNLKKLLSGTFFRQLFSLVFKPLTQGKLQFSTVLPFTGNHGLKTRPRVLKLISSIHPKIDLRVIFRPVFRLSPFFRFKDRLPMRLRPNIVHTFTCQRCCELYLGETTWNLHTRIFEQMDISAHTGNATSHSTSLPNIVAHKRESGHPISFDDFSVLTSGHSQFDTLIRKSLLIVKINPVVNVRIRSFPLMLCWYIYFPSLTLIRIRHVINLFLIHVYFCNRVGYLSRQNFCKHILLWWCCL